MNTPGSLLKGVILLLFMALMSGSVTPAHAQIMPYPQQQRRPVPAPSETPAADAPVPNKGNADDYAPFYDELYPYGMWIRTPRYGYVFQPFEAQGGWSPYSLGCWVYSDEGWVWQSPEPWSWAAYHFGNWAYMENLGWVWVPGRVWAPAWVSWRRAEYMGQICYGWAPLPPEAIVYGDGNETVIGEDLDTNVTIAEGFYHFLPEVYLGQRDYRPYYYRPSHNIEILSHSENITHIVIRKPADNPYIKFHLVKSGGPEIAKIKSSQPITEVKLSLSKTSPGRMDAVSVVPGTLSQTVHEEPPPRPGEQTHFLGQTQAPGESGTPNFDSREMPPAMMDKTPTPMEEKTQIETQPTPPQVPRTVSQPPRQVQPHQETRPNTSSEEPGRENHKDRNHPTPDPTPATH